MEFGETLKKIKETVGLGVARVVNDEAKAAWADHATTDWGIPEALKGHDLTEEEKYKVQAYMGGYDFAARFPAAGEGSKGLAALYQGLDIVKKGGLLVLGEGIKGLIKAASKEKEGYDWNVKGIEAAERDRAANSLKTANEYYQPSQDLVTQAKEEARKGRPTSTPATVDKDFTWPALPNKEELLKQIERNSKTLDKDKISDLAMDLLPVGGVAGVLKKIAPKVENAIYTKFPGQALRDTKYVQRNIRNKAELDHMIQSGFLLPKAGGKAKKYFTAVDDVNPVVPEGNTMIRIARDKVLPDEAVRVEDVEVYDFVTNSWTSMLK